jgi:hypothetical protein
MVSVQGGRSRTLRPRELHFRTARIILVHGNNLPLLSLGADRLRFQYYKSF